MAKRKLVELKNRVMEDSVGPRWQYYPKLQVNKLGEIVMAISKDPKYGLTKGILVGHTKDAPKNRKKYEIGMMITDWEVCGPLVDYDGEVSVNFKNEFKSNEKLPASVTMVEVATGKKTVYK